VRAVGGEVVEPVGQPAVPADLLGEPQDAVATGAAALLTLDPQHVELLNQVARSERAVAGHVAHGLSASITLGCMGHGAAARLNIERAALDESELRKPRVSERVSVVNPCCGRPAPLCPPLE